MGHPSESGHWYAQDGTPVFEVPGSKGKMVRPDIRHARKLNLYRGATSIMGQIEKAGLLRWKLQQMMHAALTHAEEGGRERG